MTTTATGYVVEPYDPLRQVAFDTARWDMAARMSTREAIQAEIPTDTYEARMAARAEARRQRIQATIDELRRRTGAPAGFIAVDDYTFNAMRRGD